MELATSSFLDYLSVEESLTRISVLYPMSCTLAHVPDSLFSVGSEEFRTFVCQTFLTKHVSRHGEK